VTRAFIAVALLAAAGITATASGQSITTLFSANNGGSLGGAVYFDITVGPNPIRIVGFDTNTAETVAFDWTVYTKPETSVGFESDPTAWTQVSTGQGQGMGRDIPSPVECEAFMLEADTRYGIALVMGPQAGHDYSGTGSSPSPGLPQYSNDDVTLDLGSATNVPFSGSPFRPRIWNGTIYYQVDGATCYADCDESGELDFFDFLCFQNEFAAGAAYADCDESGALDFFDFLCFQNEFAAGCP
jgi:hypothetical protein